MPSFEAKISLGSLLQIIVLLVAMVMAWSKLVTLDDLTGHYVRSDVHQLQLQMIEARMNSLDAKTDEIRSDVKDIKKGMK